MFKAVETTDQHLWLLPDTDLLPILSKTEHGLFLGYVSTMTNVLNIPEDIAITSCLNPKEKIAWGFVEGTV